MEYNGVQLEVRIDPPWSVQSEDESVSVICELS
jgi:hypothetical protein